MRQRCLARVYEGGDFLKNLTYNTTELISAPPTHPTTHPPAYLLGYLHYLPHLATVPTHRPELPPIPTDQSYPPAKRLMWPTYATTTEALSFGHIQAIWHQLNSLFTGTQLYGPSIHLAHIAVIFGTFGLFRTVLYTTMLVTLTNTGVLAS